MPDSNPQLRSLGDSRQDCGQPHTFPASAQNSPDVGESGAIALADPNETQPLEAVHRNGEFEIAVLACPVLLSPGLPLVVGRYQFAGEIGHGGMGVIHRAKDMDLGREVAVKVLSSAHQHNEKLRRRFTAEARITGQLQHPGIVPIYEMGEFYDGRPYFSMKLIEGQTLAQLLADRVDVNQDLQRLLKVFEQVCQTVAYAHSRGVVHLDLKPANVMVGAFGEVQLMDWGLAEVIAADQKSERNRSESELAPGGQNVGGQNVGGQNGDEAAQPFPDAPPLSVLGTPAYMAPEQAWGHFEKIDARTDVFGLGAILCEILTGRAPYTGGDIVQIFRQAVRAQLSYAFGRLDSCGADGPYVSLAKRCLSPKPKDRFKDAGAVVHELTTYLESVLKRAEHDLVRFFDISLDIFLIAGFDGFFRRVNSNFSRVLGYSQETLLSHPFLDFVHPQDREETIAEVAKLSQGLPTVQFRNRFRDVTDNYRWFEWTAKSIPEEGVIFAVGRDVTDRLDLEQQVRGHEERARDGLL